MFQLSIYRSTNGGATWSFAANPPGIKVGLGINSSGVALAAAYVTFLAGNFNPPPPQAFIYRSLDAGATWTQVFAATGFVFNALSMEGNVAVAVGKTKGFNGTGVIYRTGNSGDTWDLQNIETPGLFAAAIRFGETFVAGEQGDIHRRFLNPPPRGVLEFDPGALHFGHVAFNDSVPRAITLRNAGISNIVVTNIVRLGASSNQFAIGSTALPIIIPPGGSESINVFFTPTNSGNISGTLRFLANDPEGTFSAQLFGRGSTLGWVLKAPLTNSAGFTVLDVQMLSTTVGYALNSRDLYKTTNGGVTWRILNAPAGTFRCMHWITADEGYLAGGSLARPPAVDGSSFIYRTTNGGTNWTTEYSDTDHPVNNIQVFSGGTGYAVTGENPVLFNDAGRVLKTTNDGLAWFAVTLPRAGFNGAALAAVSSTEVFVSSGSVLFRSGDGGSSWAGVLTNASTLRSSDFTVSSLGWAVGNAGSLWRTTAGGDIPSEWSQVAAFTTNDLNWVQFTTAGPGWTVPTATAPEAQIFRSDDNGLTWRDEIVESPYAGPGNLRPTVVFGRASVTNSLALGTDGSVRRIEHFVNELEGLPVTQPVLDFGQSVGGVPRFTNFVLRNFGDRVLNVSNLLVDGVSGFNEDFRPTNALPFSVPVGATRPIGIITSNLVQGPRNATLSIISDGAIQSLFVELRNVVNPGPAVAAFVTDPPSLGLRVDGTNVSTPAAYTMREGAGVGEWNFGSIHTIEAPVTQVVNGVTFTFAGWEPFQDRVFTNMATNIPIRYVASYIATGQEVPAQAFAAGMSEMNGTRGNSSFQNDVSEISEIASGPPPGLPTGPYLRLTEASISNSLLGNFAVSGSILLSAESIEATLASRTLRLPANTGLPEVAELGAGSWRFSLSNQVLQLKAQTPSIELFNNVVNPPSLLSLGINLSNSNFRAQFTLPQGVKIVPGLLEVGSSSISLTHTTFFGLSVTGQVRALREPDGSDWAFRQSMNLQLRDGPFSIPLDLPASVMRLTAPGTGTEIVEIRGGSGSQFVVSRAANGVFSSSLTQVGLELLNKNVGTISATVTSSGRVLFSSAAGSPFTLGPFQLESSGTNEFDWNIKNGSLKFKLAGGKLMASGVTGWPAGGLNFPAVDFDSNGDFEKTIDLNGFTFDNILLGHAPEAEDRYITFKRLNGVLSLKMRDRHEFFGSFMRVGFDINSAGSVSGFFTGSCGVDFGGVIGYVNFASVNVSYDSGDAPYQFQQKLRVAGNDFLLKFGSGGGRICHLICGPDGCIETLCLP